MAQRVALVGIITRANTTIQLGVHCVQQGQPCVQSGVYNVYGRTTDRGRVHAEYSHNVVSIVGHRHRRWFNIGTTLQ